MTTKNSKFITTPIYYVNDKPHIGHAFTSICADFMARYYRSKGYDTFFLTGTDEHGKKIEETAIKSGMNPKEFVDSIVPIWIKTWSDLNISYDRFVRTTDDFHQQKVAKVFEEFYKNGDLYKGKYKGLYCVGCEAYYGEDELVDMCCPIHKKKVIEIEEESYFFRLSKYQKEIEQLFKSDDFILPPKYKNEMIAKVNKGLKDVSVSRKNLSWGIPLPFDKEHVVYVWYDALINYISAMDKDSRWPAVHLVGKDILWFHSVYWTAMLKSINYEYPKIFVHGWWTVNGDKMSKSLGNVITIESLTKYGVDIARFFLLRQMTYGEDSDFNPKMFNERYEEYLNNVSNLVYRVSSFTTKNQLDLSARDVDQKIIESIEQTDKKVFEYIEEFRIQEAVSQILSYASNLNKYMSDNEPWKIIKEDKKKAEDIIYNTIYGIEYLYHLLNCITPNLMNKTKDIFGFKSKSIKDFIKQKPQDYNQINPQMLLTRIEKFEF